MKDIRLKSNLKRISYTIAKKLEQKVIIVAIATTKRDKILSIGTNSYIKTHTLQVKYATQAKKPHSKTLHAEIAALLKTKKTPYRLYIMRFFKDGALGLAAPCPICSLAIKHKGVKEIIYSDSSGNFIKERVK